MTDFANLLFGLALSIWMLPTWSKLALATSGHRLTIVYRPCQVLKNLWLIDVACTPFVLSLISGACGRPSPKLYNWLHPSIFNFSMFSLINISMGGGTVLLRAPTLLRTPLVLTKFMNLWMKRSFPTECSTMVLLPNIAPMLTKFPTFRTHQCTLMSPMSPVGHLDLQCAIFQVGLRSSGIFYKMKELLMCQQRARWYGLVLFISATKLVINKMNNGSCVSISTTTHGLSTSFDFGTTFSTTILRLKYM